MELSKVQQRYDPVPGGITTEGDGQLEMAGELI
jgi:hypothetical protein